MRKACQDDGKMGAKMDEMRWIREKGVQAENYLFYSSFGGFGGEEKGGKESKKRCRFEAEKSFEKKRQQGRKRGAKREPKRAQKREKGGKKGVQK